MSRTISVSVLIRDEAHMLPLVMPCYASLQHCLKEVVFVNDGSTDGSRDVALEIASRFNHLPIVWIEHEMKRWDEQRNIGLEACTGDFILSLDGDMGFTGNLVWELEKGHFDKGDVCDFHLFYCRGDQYHYDPASGERYNWTTRGIKNCGVRYRGEAHEQPEVYGGQSKTALQSFRNKDDGLPVKLKNDVVYLFEWSYLTKDDNLLLERGRRLEKRWQKFMLERGIAPRSPNQYLEFARSDKPTVKFSEDICQMIPTMADALKHWGKKG